jgi:hypothetical protein
MLLKRHAIAPFLYPVEQIDGKQIFEFDSPASCFGLEFSIAIIVLRMFGLSGMGNAIMHSRQRALRTRAVYVACSFRGLSLLEQNTKLGKSHVWDRRIRRIKRCLSISVGWLAPT